MNYYKVQAKRLIDGHLYEDIVKAKDENGARRIGRIILMGNRMFMIEEPTVTIIPQEALESLNILDMYIDDESSCEWFENVQCEYIRMYEFQNKGTIRPRVFYTNDMFYKYLQDKNIKCEENGELYKQGLIIGVMFSEYKAIDYEKIIRSGVKYAENNKRREENEEKRFKRQNGSRNRQWREIYGSWR